MRGPLHRLIRAQRQEKGLGKMLQAIYRMMNNNIRRRLATVAGVGNNSTICNGLSLILLKAISEAGRHGGSTHPACLRSETVHQI